MLTLLIRLMESTEGADSLQDVEAKPSKLLSIEQIKMDSNSHPFKRNCKLVYQGVPTMLSQSTLFPHPMCVI